MLVVALKVKSAYEMETLKTNNKTASNKAQPLYAILPMSPSPSFLALKLRC
jgi:hypothetical protein